MISTRRIVAAVGLAVGVTGLAVPTANAAVTPETGKLNPIAMVDSLATSGIPAERRAEVPKVSGQLDKLNGLYQLEQLHQVTDLAAPATGLAGAVE